MDETVQHQSKENSFFRFVIGFIVMALAGGGFIALFFIKVPVENKDAMMFALGAVFQWAAGVVNSEYGATTTGRKFAEAAARGLEASNVANALAVASADPAGGVGDRVEEGARAGTKAGVEEALKPGVDEEEDAAPR